jgi:site-specific DNA-cytosine methylase
MPAPINSKFTYVELFVSMGGFRIALDELGGHCVIASEVDGFCVKNYQRNFGDRPAGDITRIPSECIPNSSPLHFPLLAVNKIMYHGQQDRKKGSEVICLEITTT